MSNLPAPLVGIPAMSEETIEKVRRFEAIILEQPQIPLETRHVIHGGMYARTITMPAGMVLTSALIKISTIVIVSGHATFSFDGNSIEFEGYNVVTGSAGRKQAVMAHSETDITMLFPTTAQSVEEAEAQFTDEADALVSRHNANIVTITGD